MPDRRAARVRPAHPVRPALVVLDGQSLPVADIVRLADGDARPVPGTDAMKRVEQSWHTARELAASGRVYGRSTGVGANRTEAVPSGTAADHGPRLLRSHAGAGLRPTVVTALCDALTAGALERALAVEINSAAENPLICPGSDDDLAPAACHHGGFYLAQLALALDHFRLAVVQTARLSSSRLSVLNEPGFTRLRPFLADAEPASSGVMVLEYAAGAALGDLRAFSAPASLGHEVLSRGVEEQAGFASPAARQTLRACEAYRLVVGCELVAAVRALRQRDLRPEAGPPVGRALALAESVLDAEVADRPLTDDVTAAARLLDQLASTDGDLDRAEMTGTTRGIA